MASQVRAAILITDPLPLEERIRSRAYDLYLSRAGEPGSELDDWLQAEEEIRLELSRTVG